MMKDKIVKTMEEALAINIPSKIEFEKIGGLTNKNFRVRIPEGDFVVRFPGEGTEEMINRQEEFVSTQLANIIGIDAGLLYFDCKTGVKVTSYIKNAETMHKESFLNNSYNLELVAKVLNKLHNSDKKNSVEFNVFDKIKSYESVLMTKDFKLWDDYQAVREQVLGLQNEIMRMNIKKVPCHNDPLCENFIRSGDEMYLIDWEYAGMNDPMWDVADFIIEAELPKDKEEEFIRLYLGKDNNETMVRRININKVFLDFLWALWAMLRVSCGEGQDMLDWANERYIRATLNISKL